MIVGPVVSPYYFALKCVSIPPHVEQHGGVSMQKHGNIFESPIEGFVRSSQLLPAVLPVSRATLLRMVKSGEFPKPVRLSKRIRVWRVVDVVEWINAHGPRL